MEIRLVDDIRDPDWFLADFEAYAAKHGLVLSEPVRSLVLAIEAKAEKLDLWLSLYIVFSVLLRDSTEVKRALIRNGLDPVAARGEFDAQIEAFTDSEDNYHDADEDLYSSDQKLSYRSLIGSAAIARARSLGLKELQTPDLFAAVLDAHEAVTPATENYNWTDQELNVPYNTLSHILGWYRPRLFISLDTLRRDMGLLLPGTVRQERIDQAPAHVRNGLLSLFAEFPHYEKNCFLIMPFRPTPQLKQVHEAIKNALSAEGFNVLRADDNIYSENVFTNIEAYLHGCRFAVSVFERMANDQHNANVALEIGYMLGMGKDVCLLKERTVIGLPSDLQGRLYIEFDAFSIQDTVTSSVKRWLRERRLNQSR
jgi:hypothetical protein